MYSPCLNGVITGNLIKGYKKGIYLKCSGNFIVENNTVIDTEWALRSKWRKGDKIRYNIFYDITYPFGISYKMKRGSIVDHNIAWQPKQITGFWQAFMRPAQYGYVNNIAVDPKFVNPAADDYRLLPGSPALLLKNEKGKPAGALGVAAEYKDTAGPEVKVELKSPAVKAGKSGKKISILDPWIGGKREVIGTLFENSYPFDYFTSADKIGISLKVKDNTGWPEKIKYKINNGEWEKEIPYKTDIKIKLPKTSDLIKLTLKVADNSGNWSTEKIVSIKKLAAAPALKDKVKIYTNNYGAIVSFTTNQAGFSRLKISGIDSNFKQPGYFKREYDIMDGAELVDEWDIPRTIHHIPVLTPEVSSGSRYSYQLYVKNVLGVEKLVQEGSFTIKGKAKTVYISKDGKDTHKHGSNRNPFATLQYAVDRTLPGDKIIIKRGLYSGETYISHGGTEKAAITIEAEKAGAVVLDGSGNDYAMLRIEKSDYISVKNLEIRWFKYAGVYVADSNNFKATGCRVWNKYYGNSADWPFGKGFFLHRSPNSYFEKNLLYRNDTGFDLILSPGTTVVNNTALKNLVGGLMLYFSMKDSKVYNNSFTFNGNDQMYIYTFDDNNKKSFFCDYNNWATAIGKHYNTRKLPQMEIKQRALKSGSKAIFSYNDKRYQTMEEWRKASGLDKNSIYLDPKYVAPEKYDFHLSKDSPNLKAGKDGGVIGAFGSKSEQ
jgi:parallel beta-helix repeat protein